MRIYLPATLAELDRTQGLTARLVHTVTPALRRAFPEEDDEGLEFVAQLLAADDSLELLDGAGPGRLRRVVVAADVPEGVVDPVDDAHAPSVVQLTTTAEWDEIACAHVDEPAAEADVVAALAGDEAAAERLADRDLLWYDVTELGRLAASVR